MAMVLLFEMSEDDRQCDDWPTYNYRLDTFGQTVKRVLDPAELPEGYRTHASGQNVHGVTWVPKPYCPAKETQPFVPMALKESPLWIAYSVCCLGKHVRIEENLRGGVRHATVISVGPCGTEHREHPNSVAVNMDGLPPTTQQVLREALHRPFYRVFLDGLAALAKGLLST
jgi:hypothetical protein